jgi:hypothetical protein
MPNNSSISKTSTTGVIAELETIRLITHYNLAINKPAWHAFISSHSTDTIEKAFESNKALYRTAKNQAIFRCTPNRSTFAYR